MMSYLQVIVINAVKFVKIEMHAHIRGILSESLLSQNIQFFIYVHFFNFQLFILYWCIANLGDSLIGQLAKNLPAMQEILVQFLGQEDLLEKG